MDTDFVHHYTAPLKGPYVQNVQKFCQNIKGYHENRNNPNAGALSNMSPYLHFGQLSAQAMALEVSKEKKKHGVNSDSPTKSCK